MFALKLAFANPDINCYRTQRKLFLLAYKYFVRKKKTLNVSLRVTFVLKNETKGKKKNEKQNPDKFCGVLIIFFQGNIPETKYLAARGYYLNNKTIL